MQGIDTKAPDTAAATPIRWQLPLAIRQSPLWRGGGFGAYENLVAPEDCARLAEEALAGFAHSEAHLVAEDDGEEIRGGHPRRKFLSAEGGPVQDAVYASRDTAALLHYITAARFVPTGPRGSFTYYQRPGDHLALHRDIEGCDLAMITMLHLAGAGRAQEGRLCLYPDRFDEPLSAIARSPGRGAVVQELQPGQTVLLFGGVIPHRVIPLGRGQRRIVSVLCFRLAES